MTLPTPKPGLVIRYGFLWSHEQRAGAQEGSKDRPCATIVAAQRRQDGEVRVLVAPITHAPPSDPGASLEIPRATATGYGSMN